MSTEHTQVFNAPVSFGRLAYFLTTHGLFFLTFGLTAVIQRIDPNPRFIWILAIVNAGLLVPITFFRLRDIGMSPWWSLGGIVPLVNLYVSWCCLAKPSGYALTMQSDATMKVNTAAFITIPPFLLLVAFFFVSLGRDPREVPSPLIDKAAPAFQLPQLHDPTKTFSAADMRGKVWLVNFWGTWCIACREEHPWLVEYAKANAVPIVGVDYKYSSDTSDERAAAIRWLAELGNPYSVTVYDADGRTSIDFGVYGAPETFLIDKQGVIRFKQIGPLTQEAWQNKVLPMVKQLNQ